MTPGKEIRVVVLGDETPFTRSLKRATAQAEGFAAKMDALGARMQEAGKKMTRNVTEPIIAIGVAAGATALHFEKNMALIQSSAGGSARDVKALREQVLGLAKDSQYGPNELAKAMYHLKSLGYDNATAMRALKEAVKGATAGQADLEETTSALGGALRTAMKGTGDFHGAMATLNAIVGAGNMRFDDLNRALGTGLLPAAKSAGISLREVGAALATMTDENVPASDAATRLRMTMALLGAPSQQAAKVLRAVGIDALELGQTMQKPNGLVKALELLKSHLDEIPDKATRAAVITRAFGGGQTSGGIQLLLNNLDVVKQKYDQIGKTAGDFNSRVAAQQETSLYKLRKAWSNIQVAMINVGATLAPIAAKFATTVSSLVDKFDRLSDGTKKWIMIAAGVAALAGPFLRLAGIITANPLLIPVAALSAGLVLLYERNEKFRKSVNTLWAEMPGKVSAAVQYMQAVWDRHAARITADARSAYAQVQQIVQQSLEVIRAFWARFGDTIHRDIELRFQAIIANTRASLRILTDIIKIALDILQGKWGKAWDAFKDLLKTTFKLALAILRQQIALFKNIGLAMGQALYDGVASMLGSLKNKVTGWAGSLVGAVRHPFRGDSEWWKTAGTKAGVKWTDAVQKALTDGLIKAVEIVQAAADKMTAVFNAVQTAITNVVYGATQSGIGAAEENRTGANAPGSAAGLGVVGTAKALGVGSGGVYKWGGGHGGIVKPGTYLDCSGFTYQSYTQNGFKGFPGTSSQQWETMDGPNWTSQVVDAANAMPGDLAFRTGAERPYPGHVGIVVSGRGLSATVMQYYSSGLPPNTVSLGAFLDGKFGVKRFFLVKKGSAVTTPDPGGGTGPDIDPDLNDILFNTGGKKPKKPKAKTLAQQLGLPQDLLNQIETYKTKASSLDNIGTQARSYLEKEESALEREAKLLQTKLATAKGKLHDQISKKLNDVKDRIIKVHQQILDAVIVTGDALLPANLRSRLAALKQRFAAATAMASLMTGKGADDYQETLARNLRDQASVYQQEIAGLKVKLNRSTGRQKKAIQDELKKVQGNLADVNNDILSALQGIVQAGQGNVSTAFQRVKAKMDAQFEAVTQRLLDALGVQFFQGGALTPAERALQAFQDAASRKSLQDALAQATTPEERQAAEAAIELDRLQADATAERTAADQAYAAATQKLQEERQEKEQAMNDALDALLESVLNGTGSLSDLQAIAATYGVTITEAAIPEMGALAKATAALADAFAQLAAWIKRMTGGGSSSATPPGWTDPSTPAWTDSGWWHPGLASGEPGRPSAWLVKARPGGTLARIGEGRHDEMITAVPNGLLGRGDIHLHGHVHGGTFIGDDKARVARELVAEMDIALGEHVTAGRGAGLNKRIRQVAG